MSGLTVPVVCSRGVYYVNMIATCVNGVSSSNNICRAAANSAGGGGREGRPRGRSERVLGKRVCLRSAHLDHSCFSNDDQFL